jgi:hypothetical protein
MKNRCLFWRIASVMALVAGMMAFLFLCLGPLNSLASARENTLKIPHDTNTSLGPTLGGMSYQDFEGPGEVGWPGTGCTVRLSAPGEPKQSGNHSWRIDCENTWNYVYVRHRSESWDVDFIRENNDRLVFWIYAEPNTMTDNTVGVEFYDHDTYSTEGFEAWSTQKAHYGQWTKITILFDQLPTDFDLRHVNKLEFKNYWPGTYYLDDVQVIREDRAYQSFEPSIRSLSVTDTEEFGWVWGVTSNTCKLSTERVHEGQYAWKIILNDYWGGTGIKSEQEYLTPRVITGTQSFWNADLDPEHNDRLCLWIYALPLNGLDNNVNVQFFDHLTHTVVISDEITTTDKVEYWTNQAAVYGRWTQICVPFSDVNKGLAPGSVPLDLDNIDKIQIQVYWPGTYYIDTIEVTSSTPDWDRSALKDGTLTWESSYPLNQYVLQENTVTGNPSSLDWVTVSVGTNVTYNIPRISHAWYRVRAAEVKGANNEIPFVSNWSTILEYYAPAVVIDHATLVTSQTLTWTHLAQATVYTVENTTSLTGTWGSFYTGPYPTTPLPASTNTWYRVRAGKGTEQSDWSPPLRKPDPITQDFLQACGTAICDGETALLNLGGVNLGGYFIIEPWMNEWRGDDPPLKDDYSIRAALSETHGALGRDALLQIYQDSYLTEADFDILMRMGIKIVRLPLYYRDLQDDDGNLLPGGFEKIDWIVNACTSRGIYVLLDLHGAPGSQSRYFHTGRIDYNRLFTDTVEGETFRDQTVALWGAIASHYKDNSMVLGYDLLNEPTGVITDPNRHVPTSGELENLWNFYDRLYDAIRGIDPNHIIVMEGIWDWDTLPNPSDYGWENVVYQFHYYCPNEEGLCSAELEYDGYVQAHKDFIDSKVAMADVYQDLYQVPAMVGEFNAYDSREVWEYYIATFNEQGWSWAIWSYKVSSPNSRWGLLTDQGHSPDDIPIFRSDPYPDLERELSEPFDTLTRYVPNYSLINVIRRRLLPQEVYLPIVLEAQ